MGRWVRSSTLTYLQRHLRVPYPRQIPNRLHLATPVEPSCCSMYWIDPTRFQRPTKSHPNPAYHPVHLIKKNPPFGVIKRLRIDSHLAFFWGGGSQSVFSQNPPGGILST
ncbi:uncharacterized protein BYT42DRAFT_372581 [Radiomyces spectabilis]|uniref:uncharacterized protein n=1 Tax=Radiomyces spectabilis TaxID=64574 RepID=UPI0022208128|nr:uncharacterized protein BYT42DRAFT_372581 [Radiomyces spectabilis]KAI8376038.1 hypothetical protein BYT42DRAFT_372581 [Radiomyces spectabilis]